MFLIGMNMDGYCLVHGMWCCVFRHRDSIKPVVSKSQPKFCWNHSRCGGRSDEACPEICPNLSLCLIVTEPLSGEPLLQFIAPEGSAPWIPGGVAPQRKALQWSSAKEDSCGAKWEGFATSISHPEWLFLHTGSSPVGLEFEGTC